MKKPRLNNLFWLKIDRMLAGSGKKQLGIPFGVAAALLLILTLLFLIFGYASPGNECSPSAFKPSNEFDAAYYYMLVNGGENKFPGSHIAGGIITLLGIILVAILTSSITNFLDKRAKNYLNGESAYKFKDHIVVLGANDILYSIIEQKASPGTYILVQTGKDVESTRREVFSFLGDKVNRDRIVFVYGDRTSPEDVDRLCLPYAREAFIIGDTSESDQTESYRDSYNMDSLNAIADILPSGGKKLLCHVLFEYQTTFAAFQFSDIEQSINEKIVFKPFNFYEMWAQQVLVKGYAGKGKYTYDFLYRDDDGFIDATSEKTVHLIIIGMTKMGMAMAIEAAHLCHFPNYIHDKSKKTKITFIDPDACVNKEYFMGRFKELFRLSETHSIIYGNSVVISSSVPSPHDDWLDIEWEFITGRTSQKEVCDYLEKSAADKKRIVTIAVCQQQAQEAIATALYLPESVYENCLQILTYQRLSGYLVNNLAKAGDMDKYRVLKPFGMVDMGYDTMLDDDTLAMAVDYVYANGESDPELKGFDKDAYFNNSWMNGGKTVSERWSSAFNANSIGVKLRTSGVDIKDVFSPSSEHIASMEKQIRESLQDLAEMEHNRWNIEKLLTGYRALTAEELNSLENLRKQVLEMPEEEKDGSTAKKEWKALRNSLKSLPKRAHLDIRPRADLYDVDPASLEYDNILCLAIPSILKQLGRKMD